jgi:hypothetical protein
MCITRTVIEKVEICDESDRYSSNKKAIYGDFGELFKGGFEAVFRRTVTAG